jgi:hypothetical protein
MSSGKISTGVGQWREMTKFFFTADIHPLFLHVSSATRGVPHQPHGFERFFRESSIFIHQETEAEDNLARHGLLYHGDDLVVVELGRPDDGIRPEYTPVGPVQNEGPVCLQALVGSLFIDAVSAALRTIRVTMSGCGPQ